MHPACVERFKAQIKAGNTSQSKQAETGTITTRKRKGTSQNFNEAQETDLISGDQVCKPNFLLCISVCETSMFIHIKV